VTSSNSISASNPPEPLPTAPLPRWRRWGVITIFLLIVVGWPVFALTSGPTSPDEIAEVVSQSRLWLYASTGLILWLVFLLVWIAQRLGRRSLTELGFTQPRWIDPLVGFGFLFAANIVLHLSSWLLQGGFGMGSPDETVRMILPEVPLERVGWVILSLTAGICEETCFRGFVLLRGVRYLRHTWLAVIVSSLAFGSGHLYQGPTGATLIVLYGVMFCGLRLWQRSLWPGIWAHIWQDLGAMAAGPMAGP
jgi:membrane protease YdiL (CAAX protease family)